MGQYHSILFFISSSCAFLSIQSKRVLLNEKTVCGIAECWKNHRLQTKKQITYGSFLRLQSCYWYAAFFRLHPSLHSLFRPYPHLLMSHSSLLLSLSFPYTYGQGATQPLQFRFLAFSQSMLLIYQWLSLLSPGYSMVLGRLLWPILLDVESVISVGFYEMCGCGSFWGERLFSLNPLRSCKYECGLFHRHDIDLVTHQENFVRQCLTYKSVSGPNSELCLEL